MKNTEIKKYLYRTVFAVLSAILLGCAKYPQYVVTHSPFVDYKTLELYVGAPQGFDSQYVEEAKRRGMFIEGKVQLSASPREGKFSWRSENEEIVKVSQTGLVEGVSEGLAAIFVSSGEDETKIDVRVRKYISCNSISLTRDNIMLLPKGKQQVFAAYSPDNVTGPMLWTSSDDRVASVYQDGTIIGLAKGVAHITVKVGNVEKSMTVSVPELEKCDKTEWSIAAYSDAHTEGGGVNTIIDGNLATNNYWHSMYSPNAPLPHWAIIDMKAPVDVARIVTVRRNNGDTKSVEYYIGDEPDENSATWKKIAQGMYPSGQNSVINLTLDLTERASGRYLKLIVTDSYRVPFTAITEVEVYKGVFN